MKMKTKTESKSSQTALRCARKRMQQSLSKVRLSVRPKMGVSHRSRGLERSLLCAAVRSIAVTRTGTYGPESET
jgi:hypothetical protein